MTVPRHTDIAPDGEARSQARHRFDVVMRPAGPHLTVTGELDLAAAPRLSSLLAVLMRYPAPLTVDTARVTFADCAGLAPLVAASRRNPEGVRTVFIDRPSRAFRRPFEILGIACEPSVDAESWYAAETSCPSLSNTPSTTRRRTG